MRGQAIAAIVGVTAVVVGLTHGGRLRTIPANIRRYSMPGATAYDLVTRLVYGGRYQAIADAIAGEAPEGGAVLDVGCGSGEVLTRLAAIAPTLRLTGVDVDAGMLDVAERKATRRLDRSVRPMFVQADAAALPVADSSVDLVVSSFAAHHLPDRHAALAEMLRVLRPGGKVIIWDIADPHAPSTSDGGVTTHGAGASHGHGHPRPSDDGASVDRCPHSIVGTLRMIVRFGRLPAERYEFAKPASA
jgi:ubiquinone/menaquinone biosynthesis C-methylase UbiE